MGEGHLSKALDAFCREREAIVSENDSRGGEIMTCLEHQRGLGGSIGTLAESILAIIHQPFFGPAPCFPSL
ncbi:hypothetical protein HIO72_11085 [Halomonas sp. PA5]|uniref:hypothetical protein n=1 Tax=Halomonas sp. PA5 TaxID=2730357 RepID=UPI001597C0C0|nr:hypothetical protein [Halomonas sp. PA5]QJQ95756.1 hypothetical protein HIO72_11085 [Halomonas sp. PA5]